MSTAFALRLLVIIGVAAQILVPDRAMFHAGWYSVGLAVLASWAVIVTRRQPLIAFGIAVLAFAGVASGLLGPDPRTVIGAPGASVRVDEAGGTLLFPLAQGDAPTVTLERGSSTKPIGARRFTATALLRSVPRSVVAVQAFDRRGAHLTITQPTGSAFLSPVLLMGTTQNINGLDLPYDTFAVPAAHRIVRAVLFSQAQAASMPALAGAHAPVVLFDLEDDSGVSIPDLMVVAAGFFAILIGELLTQRARQGKIAGQ